MKVISAFDGWFSFYYDLLLESWINENDLRRYSEREIKKHFVLEQDNVKELLRQAKEAYAEDMLNPEYIDDVCITEYEIVNGEFKIRR